MWCFEVASKRREGQGQRPLKRWARLIHFHAATKEFRAADAHRRNLVRHFAELTKGCSAADIMFLLDCGHGKPEVFIYSPSSRSVAVPAEGEIAWHVEFLLRAPRKHIFRLSTVPSLEKVGAAVTGFVNKVRWAAF